ncbi:MAG: SDR family NAD(P)-dependent oxidoreductase [Rhodobacteraceae bacterium]|nr:SDR family NAD(P)-dependent oxidoreductase [Paracoccaceae bacterium]
MKNVLIIGASGGIGGAIAAHHMTLGDSIIRLSRSIDGLDITDTQSVTDHLGRLDCTFDRVIVATGALSVNGAAPEKTIKSIDPVAMADQFAVNAIGPALILTHAGRLLRKDRASVFSVLSAKVGSIGDNRLGGWVSYRAAKAALNQIVHTSAIELARSHPQSSVVALHPGTVETPFTSKYLARHASVPAGQAAANLVKVMDDLTPAQSGGFYDYSGTALLW